MRSVFYRPTGKFTHQGCKPDSKAGEIVRNNEIHAPEFLRDTRGKSMFKNNDEQNGIDTRLNAVGDTADTATGYQIQTDTLTYIIKQVTEQVFYTFPITDFIPLHVGEGAWSDTLLTNVTYSLAEDFESGKVNTGSHDARQSVADVAIAGVNQKVQLWLKGIQYTIADVQKALLANSWDPIMAKHKARFQNWQLGLQTTMLLGDSTDTNLPGLLTLSNITTNTGVITKYIKSMSAAELQTFVGTLISTYFSNTNSTTLPNRFAIPYQDYLGLSILTTGTVGTYPVPLLEYITNAFKAAVKHMEPDFKIVPLAYCDAAVNNTMRGINKNIYMLYRYDDTSLRASIPIDYTVTQAGTINNFGFQDSAYGQYTGAVALKPLEVLKFQF